MPTHYLQGDKLGRGDDAALDRDQLAPLRAGLFGVAPLQVPRKHDAGIRRPDHLARMHVAKREIVVTLVAQHLDGSGRI